MGLVNAQPAIRGLLVGAAHDYADNSVVLSIKIERLQYASFALAAGVPDPTDAAVHLPSVMLLACSAPRHPEQDQDVMARAAFAYLDDAFARSLQPLTPELAGCLSGLIATVDAMPELRASPDTP